MAIKIKNKNNKKVSIIIFEKILHIIARKIIIKTSPFFMNRSGLISILVTVLVFLPLASFSKEKPKLAKKYENWLKDEVIYIITPVEKEVFSKLEIDRDRDLFMEEFWRQRDPTPGTPRNEFKEEHFRRIEFANKKFGRGTPFKGWRTDRGRFYIKLGTPSYVEKYMDPDVHPIEIWYYSGVEKKISIPEGKDLHMSALVLARKVSRDLPKSQESRAFQLGKLQIYPSVNNIFQKEDSLFLFLQIYGLNHNLKQAGILEFSFSQEERTLQTIFKNISEYNSDRDFLEEIPLEKLKPGEYTVKVSLLDKKGEEYFSETERFSIITEPVPGSWVVAQTSPPADDPYYAYIIGVQYLNKGELQKAQMELADAYARKPDALDYALSYARVLLILKDFQRVKEILIPFVEAKQEDFGLFYSLGNASQEIGEFGEAISYYQRALRLKGNITLILNAMGECYLQLGETEQALQAWKKSLDTNPHQEKIKKLIKNLKEKN